MNLLKNHIISAFSGIWMLAIILTVGVTTLTSCKKPSAQYPSNKIRKNDSTEIYLRGYNQDVIQKEDSAILALVTNQSVVFKKSDIGIWYYLLKQTNNAPLANDSSALIDYKLYNIHGELLDEERGKTIHFGKKEVPIGLEEGLKLMKKGEQAKLIVPSYLAFGTQGTEIVEPYSPVIYWVESL